MVACQRNTLIACVCLLVALQLAASQFTNEVLPYTPTSAPVATPPPTAPAGAIATLAPGQTLFTTTTSTTTLPCLRTSTKYMPLLSTVESTRQMSWEICQASCAHTTGCEKFSFNKQTLECTYSAATASPSPDALWTSGRSSCPTPPPTPPNECLDEVASDGFPGVDAAGSNEPWYDKSQPQKLQCWPKDPSSGDLLNCDYSVIQDTENGWPGLCDHLYLQTLTNGQTCDDSCNTVPTCQGYQLGTDSSCWQGLGQNCYYRPGFTPVRAQRLQHGQVRVLQDLKGWQVFGLSMVFTNNGNGYWHGDEEMETKAVDACRKVCYSDIKCDYWSFSMWFGCWVEDTNRATVNYPLTLSDMTRDSNFAKSAIAGEYIQHICDPNYIAPGSRDANSVPICALENYQLVPLDSAAQPTVLANPMQCQQACQADAQCQFFSYFHSSGRCHLTATEPSMEYAGDAVAGPRDCPPTTPDPSARCEMHTMCVQAGHTGLCCPNLDFEVFSCCQLSNPSTILGMSGTTAEPFFVGAGEGAATHLKVETSCANITFATMSDSQKAQLQTTVTNQIVTTTNMEPSQVTDCTTEAQLTTVRRLDAEERRMQASTAGTTVTCILATGDQAGVNRALNSVTWRDTMNDQSRASLAQSGGLTAIKAYGTPPDNTNTYLDWLTTVIPYEIPVEESWFQRYWWLLLLLLCVLCCGFIVIYNQCQKSKEKGRHVVDPPSQGPDESQFDSQIDPLLEDPEDGLPTGGIHDVGNEKLPFPEAGLPNKHGLPFPEAGLPMHQGHPQMGHYDPVMGAAGGANRFGGADALAVQQAAPVLQVQPQGQAYYKA